MEIAPVPRAIRMAGLLVTIALPACLPGGCSEAAAAEFVSFEHYQGEQLDPQPHPFGACHDTLTTGDDPAQVLDAYRAEAESKGYTVTNISAPPADASGGAFEVGLEADNGEFHFSITAEITGVGENIYSVFLDEVQ